MVEDTRKARVQLEVSEKGAKETAKSLGSVGDSIDELNRLFRHTADDGVEQLTDAIRHDLGGALDEVVQKSAKIDVGGGLGGGGLGGGGLGGGGNAPAAAKFRGAASLVGGGEIVGLIDDLQDLGEGFSQLAEAGGGLGSVLVDKLTPAIGSTAAGVVVAGGAFAAAGVAIIALGAVIKSFVDEQAKQQKVIEDIVNAQRSVDEKINAGAATADLNRERALLIKNLEDEKKRVADLSAQYEAQFNPQGFSDNLAKLVSGTEQGLANSIDTAKENAANLQIEIDALSGGLKDSDLAANDAAEAEKKLAAERTAAVLETAAAAGQEEATRRKALSVTEEQNEARLDAIVDERAAIEAQIAVLQSSGDTSEQVSDQIKKLNGQLASLGKESKFIESTALAVSRIRDAEKKAIKDAEEAAKKQAAEAEKRRSEAIASIKKHNDAIRSASDAFSKATADIARKRKEGEFDIRTEMGRDLADIALKNTQDVTKAIKEDWRNARDDAFKNADEIADIRSEGRKAEQEAIRDGDFKQLFLAREATKERLAEEAKTDEREAQLRALHLEDAKDDLKTSLRQEQDARRTAGIRAFEDLKLNLSREMTLASEARSSEFAKFASHYNRMAGLQQQYINRVEGMLSGGRLSGARMTAQPRLTQQIGQIIRKS